MKKLLIIIFLLLPIFSFPQYLGDSKDKIFSKLDSNFTKPIINVDKKFKKTLIETDYLFLNLKQIRYITTKCKETDVIYNFILDENDICVCLILEIKTHDMEDPKNSKWCKTGVPNRGSIYFKLVNKDDHWLLLEW